MKDRQACSKERLVVVNTPKLDQCWYALAIVLALSIAGTCEGNSALNQNIITSHALNNNVFQFKRHMNMTYQYLNRSVEWIESKVSENGMSNNF